MEFKRTVAGISAAAIAVTQVAAVVPMSAFAAHEEDVESNYGFALKLKSQNESNTNYDGAYANPEDNQVVFTAKSIENAADANGSLDFSFAATINDENAQVGDKYNFSIEGLEIFATEKGTAESTKTLDDVSTNLDAVMQPGKVKISAPGTAGAEVVITYIETAAATNPYIALKDSKGEKIVAEEGTSGPNKTLTFTLTEDSAASFDIEGNNVTITSVSVTTVTETKLLDLVDNSGFACALSGAPQPISISPSASVGDIVKITYGETADFNSERTAVSVTDLSDNGISDSDSSDSNAYTFEITDETKNGFKVDGNGYTVSAITLTNTDVDTSKTPSGGDATLTETEKTAAGKVTVESTEFASAAATNKIRVTYAANGEEDGSVVIKSGSETLDTLAALASKTTVELALGDNLSAVQANGIEISGSGVTVSKVELVTPAKEGTKTTLLTKSDKTWTQVKMNGWWDGDQDIVETAINEKIGTVEAFKTNFENITATWTSFTCTKTVLDEGELWAGENTFDDKWAGSWATVGATDVKAGGKIIVEYKNASSGQIILQTSGYKAFEGNLASAKATTGASGSLSFTLDAAAAAEISKNGFVAGGGSVTITSIKYEAPAEASTKITAITSDTNFQNVLKLYDTNGDGKLTATEIAAITELGTEKKDDKFKDEAASLAAVKDFKGIDKLTALTTLVVKNNTQSNFKALDLSANTALVNLDLTGCTNLADLKLPKTDTVKKLALSDTAITAINTSEYSALTDLDVSGTKITELNVGENANLVNLNLAGAKVGELAVSTNTKLVTLNAKGCGLKAIDVSANTALTTLDVSDNELIALNLAGLNALASLDASNNVRKIGEVYDGEFDLKSIFETEDLSNVTITTTGLENTDNVLKGVTDKGVEYDYTTGATVAEAAEKGFDKVSFKLAPEKITAVNFVVKYTEDKTAKEVKVNTWDDVLKAISNKNIDYTIELKNDVKIDTLKFPAATKANSVTLAGAKTITTNSTSVTLPTNVTLEDVTIKAVDKDGKTAAKNFTLTASKNLTIDGIKLDAAATTIKGGAKSVLTVADETIVNSVVSGFGTLKLDTEASATFNKNVTVKELKLNRTGVLVGENAVLKFTNIECGSSNGGIMYTSEKFIPVAVTNITGEGNLQIAIRYKKAVTDSEPVTVDKFTAGDVVLNSKTVDLTKIKTYDSLPTGTTLGKSGKSGNEVTVMETVMTVNGVDYAQWSDVLNTIAAEAKEIKANTPKGQTPVYKDYTVELSDNLVINNAFKMPAAKTYNKLTITSATSKAIKFTGNISLTGTTVFKGVKLDAVKKTNDGFVSNDFTITAGKNDLTLENVTAGDGKSIKNITSSGVVNLEKVTVGGVSAATINVTAPIAMGGAVALNADWEAKAIDATSVTVTGNLSAKTALNLKGDKASLTVKGTLNAAEIKSTNDSAVLVVYTQKNGKSALTIGKNGIAAGSKKINFVLADYETGKTAHIVDDVILGTIAGTYADEFKPSKDNLTPDSTYYIVKDGKNLVAKSSEATSSYITIRINEKPARYKDLDAAIKDISATGKSSDNIEITIPSQESIKDYTKLPLPTSGKYGTLTYKAGSAVTFKLTTDLALTGNLVLDENVKIVKVAKGSEDAQPIGVNVGKYSLTAKEALSADKDGKSQIAGLSGSGKFITAKDVIVTGKVNSTELVLNGNTVTLEGNKSGFAGSIDSTAGKLAYDKENSKNVKFINIKGAVTLAINGATIAENDNIAAISGDYTKEAVTVEGSALKIVRSGNNLKAVAEANVVEVEASNGKPTTTGTRTYDTLANAMTDISRIKDNTASYSVKVKEGNELVLPKAKTYGKLIVTTATPAPVAIKTTKDLVLTGNLQLGTYVTLNKVEKKTDKVQSISVNVGNYEFVMNGKLSPIENVSQIVNISGKGAILVNDAINVSGRVNVGTFTADKTTLSAKSSFAAAKIEVYSGNTLSYPMSIAKNVKFGEFTRPLASLKLDITDVAAGQIAALTGDYADGSVVIGDGTAFKAVRSGTKLMAVAVDTDVVTVSDGTSTRVYDTYANAIADINKLGVKTNNYTVTISNDLMKNATKLALPAKGKYNSIKLQANDSTNIKVKSNITLSGNLIIGENVTLEKVDSKGKNTLLTITSPKNSGFTATTEKNGVIVNAKLNGEKISEATEFYTLGQNLGEGVEATMNVGLPFAKKPVAEDGKIVVTFKDAVTGDFGIYMDDGNYQDVKNLEGAEKVEFKLDSEAARRITNNGFTFKGTVDSTVTSVKYVAPVKYTLGQELGDGVELTAEGMIFYGATNFDKTGVIEVTFEEDAPENVKLVTKNTGAVISSAVRNGKVATFTLSAEDVTKLTSNEFVLNGTGTVKSVKYTAPDKKDFGAFDPAVELAANGTIFFNAKDVAKNGVITVNFTDNYTGDVTLVQTGADANIATKSITGEETKSFVLDTADKAAEITKNGFILKVSAAANVSAVYYSDPTEYTVGEATNGEDGVAIGTNGLVFKKANVAEDGILTVTLKDSKTGTLTLEKTGAETAIVTKEISGTTASIKLTAEEAAEITANGFILKGISDAEVVSVSYKAPTVYEVGKIDSDVNLDEFGMTFKKLESAEKTGVITVKFAAAIDAATITLNEKNGTLIATAAKSGDTATFTLTAAEAAKLSANSFILKSSANAGTVKSVTYTEPAKKDLGTFDPAIELAANGTIFFNAKDVAKNGTITVTFDVYYTGDVTLVKTGADANIVAKTVADATTAVFTLNTEEAAEITENGFILKVNAAAKVGSVTYEAPAPVVTKYDVDVALPESGVAIGEGLTFNAKTVAENGKIVVTFKDNVTGNFVLEKVSTGEIDSKTLDAANKVEFTLDSDAALEISDNGFVLTGVSTAVVASVTYEAPAPVVPEVTNVDTLPWSGSVVFGTEGGKDLKVAASLITKEETKTSIIKVTFSTLTSTSGTIVLKKANGTVIETKNILNEDVLTLQFQLTDEQAAELFTNGFTITATNVTLTNVSSEAVSLGSGGSQD